MVTRRGAGSLLFFLAVTVRALPITEDNKNTLADQSEEEKRGDVMFKSKPDWSTDYGWPKDSSAIEGNRLDYLPTNRDNSPWKSNLHTDFMYLPYLQKRQKQRHRYDPGLKFIGLGKRQRQRPKYDPGWKFIGLGKRDAGDISSAKRDTSILSRNPYLGILALANLTDFFHNLKMDLRSDQASSTNSVEGGVEGKSNDLPNANSVVYVRDRKPSAARGSKARPVYDPGWRLTGLGK